MRNQKSGGPFSWLLFSSDPFAFCTLCTSDNFPFFGTKWQEGARSVRVLLFIFRTQEKNGKWRRTPLSEHFYAWAFLAGQNRGHRWNDWATFNWQFTFLLTSSSSLWVLLFFLPFWTWCFVFSILEYPAFGMRGERTRTNEISSPRL